MLKLNIQVGYTSLWDGILQRHTGDLAGRKAAELALVTLLHETFSSFDLEVARRPLVYKVKNHVCKIIFCR